MDFVLTFINYILYGIMVILLIFQIISFFIRKKLVGKIHCKIKFSKIRFVFLACGIFTICVGIAYLKLASERIDISYLRGIFTIVSGLIFFNMYFLSNIFIGMKGISFSVIPFFISIDKIQKAYIQKNYIIIQKINSKTIKIGFNNKNLELTENILSKIK